MEQKKIKHFSHPGDPRKDQILMAIDWTPRKIPEYHEAYKAWHTKAFGETEKQRLTKGKKIVIWGMEYYKREPREYVVKKKES